MKNYVIIGGSSGIGQALCALLAHEGHQVFASYHSHPISAQPGIEVFKFNSQTDSFDAAQLPDTIHGLAYCPGAIALKPFERIREEDFLADYQLQVLGAIKVLQKLMPNLKKAQEASVVLFSTVAVATGLPFHSLVSSSKGAIEGLTKALAAEYAPVVRFNAIAPSLTDTPLAAGLLNTDQKREANAARHPMKRIGTAEDIAQLAAFLLSDKSSWITGQIHHIDGGISTIKN